jgi:hypothetical protein
MESMLIDVGNVVSLRRRPFAVMDKPVFQVNATRRRKHVVTQAQYSGESRPDGIYFITGKPNKPAA